MARDIKAIQCPHCGSTSKTELKPEFYRCQNCGTEYYLDSDDVHIYYHHEPASPPNYSPVSPVNAKLPVYVLIGAVLLIAAAYFIAMLFQPKRNYSVNSYISYKTPRTYYSSFVYTNTATGDPVYMRIGSDYIDKGNNNKPEYETHVQFNNAATGKLIADRLMQDDDRHNSRCVLSFKTYTPDLIYAIGCGTLLLQLDAKNNQLTDITQSLFKSYPQLSSGVARLEFDYNKDMINVMSNEGDSYHYFPALKKLAVTEEEADAIWKQQFNQHYFEFGSLGNYFDDQKKTQLVKTRYSKETGQTLRHDLTPGRKYFDPKIIYQDDHNLLITVNTTAAADPPFTVQSINVQTGKINWTLPPDRYYLYATAKCRQGFAIEYRRGDEADYVHGVLVVSNTGKLVHNYQLGRTE